MLEGSEILTLTHQLSIGPGRVSEASFHCALVVSPK